MSLTSTSAREFPLGSKDYDKCSCEHFECILVGMQAHMLWKVVRVAKHIGLAVPQLEFVQRHIQDLCFMETNMWEAAHEIQTHWNT